ncbi:6684_t:CDS:2 [Entrophospora sp. SA101]|nr:6684_t:CDS:2 [Entrophospora sp. SA101]
MGANEEQIYILISLNIDPYSYILVLTIGVYQELNELEILSSSSYRITPNSNNDLRKDDGNGDDVEKISFEVDNLLPDKNRYS